jgi:predicted DNA-binding antitoxin AbrB/MazE fold protein
MNTVHAIFEKGVFRPIEPVDLPEHSKVEFEPRVVKPGAELPSPDDEIDEILSRRYRSGHHDTAERHDEHQP